MKKWRNFLTRFFLKFYSDKQVQERYVKAGGIFGDALSYAYLGEPAEVLSLLNRWAKWEKEYAKRGYKTFSLDAFIAYGGYRTPLEGLEVKREENEPSVIHAEVYRQKYLGRIKPAVDINKLMAGEGQTGQYVLPTTEK